MEGDMTQLPIPIIGRNLHGRPLRRLLVVALADASGPMSIADLAHACEQAGVCWGDDRSSKLISDALRWEMRWGRVRRVGRGRYEFVGAPRTTMWRIRRQATEIATALRWAHELVAESALDPMFEWEIRDQLNLPDVSRTS